MDADSAFVARGSGPRGGLRLRPAKERSKRLSSRRGSAAGRGGSRSLGSLAADSLLDPAEPPGCGSFF
jgi:hypothetical protein